jgi:hypothetical protein
MGNGRVVEVTHWCAINRPIVRRKKPKEEFDILIENLIQVFTKKNNKQ